MTLKEIRKARGLSQAALAATAEIPLRNYQRYEAGELDIENMTLGKAVKLADALGVEPRDLLKEREPEA